MPALSKGLLIRRRSVSLSPLLEVEGLHVTFPGRRGDLGAVRGVDLTVGRGETLAVVGESGAGKSVTGLAVMGLLSSALVTGSVRYRGDELVGADERRLNKVRGRAIGMVFQDPMSALNPLRTVGTQVAEAVRVHGNVSREQSWQQALGALELAGIPRPSERARSFPHQLSGGLRQRVMIAMAMVNRPEVLIADEPTTALDVTVQAQILETLQDIQQQTGLAMVLITHDLGIVANVADRLAVMYAGRIVEDGTAESVLRKPRMPYTAGLLSSQPRLDRQERARLPSIPGTPPSPLAMPAGCPFAPRCPLSRPQCRESEPPLLPTDRRDQRAACHYWKELAGEVDHDSLFTRGTVHEPDSSSPTRPRSPAGRRGDPTRRDEEANGALLDVRHLVKHYPLCGGGVLRRTVGRVQAVSDVSFTLLAGQTLAVVGESGCGKSTLARAVLQLEPPTSGSVRFDGRELTQLTAADLREVRREAQIVSQDPYGSFDPRMPVGASLAEPLRVHSIRGRQSERIRELLATVDLSPDDASRYPHAFSGGQRQRLAIARALALEPRLVVLDEPVSALDASIQAGVLNLLADLQQQLRLAYVLIAHDLAVVRHVADQIAVMYLGSFVEVGSRADIYERPAHPYTQALLSAVPTPDPNSRNRRGRIPLAGEIADPADPPSGCRFRTRCPRAEDICAVEEPALVDRGQGHPVACHFAEEMGPG